jgi:hypothetical protein
MATLSVPKFGDPYGADPVLMALEGLQEQGTIGLEDAAVRQDHMHLVHFEGGKAVEHRGARDALGMMRQLGVVPGPGQTGNPARRSSYTPNLVEEMISDLHPREFLRVLFDPLSTRTSEQRADPGRKLVGREGFY